MVTGKLMQTLSTSKPWLISQPSIVENLLNQQIHKHFGAFKEEEDDEGGSIEPNHSCSILENGVAVLCISGVIVPSASTMEEYYYGVCSCQRLMQEFDALVADENVKAIVFEISSPGGNATLVKEFADTIYGCRGKKALTAYTSDIMCSAAYYIGAACDQVIASPSATVGSVGAVIAMAKFKANENVDFYVFAKGDLKAAGSPYTAMTEKEQKFFEDMVDKSYQQFSGDIAKYRGKSLEEVQATDSAYFDAEEVVGLFIDELMDPITFMKEVQSAFRE